MEHVVTVESVNGMSSRLPGALEERLGLRTLQARDAETAFLLLAAGKSRFGIASVKRHECRHDEGVGNCASAPAEDA